MFYTTKKTLLKPVSKQELANSEYRHMFLLIAENARTNINLFDVILGLNSM